MKKKVKIYKVKDIMNKALTSSIENYDIPI